MEREHSVQRERTQRSKLPVYLEDRTEDRTENLTESSTESLKCQESSRELESERARGRARTEGCYDMWEGYEIYCSVLVNAHRNLSGRRLFSGTRVNSRVTFFLHETYYFLALPAHAAREGARHHEMA